MSFSNSKVTVAFVAVALGVALAAAAPVATAGTVTGTLAGAGAFTGTSPGASVHGDDDAREYLLTDVNDDGKLDVGDVLRGMFQLTQAQVTPPSSLTNTVDFGGNSGNNEWTGLFQIKITGKSGNATDGYTFTFGPDAGFSEAGALGLAGKAMVLLYEDSGVDYTQNTTALLTSTEDLIGTAKNGSLFWTLGYTGALNSDGEAAAASGEGWSTTAGASDNPALPISNSSNTLASFNLGLNRVSSQGTGGGWVMDLLADASLGFSDVEFLGAGTVQPKGNLVTPFEIIGDKVSLDFQPVSVPTPTAVLAGFALLGLMGLGRVRRRRQLV
jgi:MYXO-CTERM domain-containing protein